jgi:hypothetical protein
MGQYITGIGLALYFKIQKNCEIVYFIYFILKSNRQI